ncbi:helix-turn-helix domain-containing protein [Chryseobacterium sp. MFBS3-17]|uniref:helix-turn-helix domain-containing protein n=1 Tax=Chryseobacterium sp. MFBS3-17 TaxID=2886689 RepID=UPI001D0E55AF|nr:helix-turn-helix transcriptional regulator [Chryseobacterium sp. MFBS3-17]MCC2590300.1 helix-turn-helix domain-containing protein [Chryseobacterium sp. MFBS3-17]
MSEREQIAERLKEARIMSGLSQENAAKILQIHRPAISEIESGRRKVSAEEIIQFAKLYKVSTSWLLLKEEDESAFDEQIKIAARELSSMDESDRKKLLEILRILPK